MRLMRHPLGVNCVCTSVRRINSLKPAATSDMSRSTVTNVESTVEAKTERVHVRPACTTPCAIRLADGIPIAVTNRLSYLTGHFRPYACDTASDEGTPRTPLIEGELTVQRDDSGHRRRRQSRPAASLHHPRRWCVRKRRLARRHMSPIFTFRPKHDSPGPPATAKSGLTFYFGATVTSPRRRQKTTA